MFRKWAFLRPKKLLRWKSWNNENRLKTTKKVSPKWKMFFIKNDNFRQKLDSLLTKMSWNVRKCGEKKSEISPEITCFWPKIPNFDRKWPWNWQWCFLFECKLYRYSLYECKMLERLMTGAYNNWQIVLQMFRNDSNRICSNQIDNPV